MTKGLAAALRRIDTRIRNNCEVALYVTADEIAGDFRQVTARWSHKPKFARIRTANKNIISVTIEPDGKNAQIFKWVDQGTKGPYLIPKFGPMLPGQRLTFRSGYSARTQPRGKYNQGSGQASGAWVSKERVIHPGIKAREFTQTIAEDALPILVQNERLALRRV